MNKDIFKKMNDQIVPDKKVIDELFEKIENTDRFAAKRKFAWRTAACAVALAVLATAAAFAQNSPLITKKPSRNTDTAEDYQLIEEETLPEEDADDSNEEVIADEFEGDDSKVEDSRANNSSVDLCKPDSEMAEYTQLGRRGSYGFRSRSISEVVFSTAWKQMFQPEQYDKLTYASSVYTAYCGNISKSEVGYFLASVYANGAYVNSSGVEEKIYSSECYIYRLNNISTNAAVAVRFPDSELYHCYFNESYSPSTLGDLIVDLNLNNTISITELQYYSDSHNCYYIDTPAKEDALKYLTSDKSVKNGFTGLGSNPSGYFGKRIVICFDIKLLGIRGADFTVTEDGGLTTNVTKCAPNPSFCIGADKYDGIYNLLCSVGNLE